VLNLIVIGLIGMPGAGKGECVHIALNAGFKVIQMGELVRAMTRYLGLDLTDENIGEVAHSEREKYGYGIWAERTLEEISKFNYRPDDMLIIDGIRGEAELKIFRDAFGDRLKTIAIKMPDKKRFELLQQRNRSDAPMSWEDFIERDKREDKWGIKNALDDADYIIFNTGTLSELKNEFRELLINIQNNS